MSGRLIYTSAKPRVQPGAGNGSSNAIGLADMGFDNLIRSTKLIRMT